ncbi:MAG: hypothetical protein M5R40_26640 [Anaerolineae bacterium]|nr:hypothetical protein [Anaerolineae bacterium]
MMRHRRDRAAARIRRWMAVILACFLAGCTLQLPEATGPAPPAGTTTAAAATRTATPLPPTATATPAPALPTAAVPFGPVVSGPATDTPPPPADAAPTATGSPAGGGFGPVVSGDATATPAPLTPASTLRFVLRDEAIRFQPHPDGCGIMVLAGQVYDAEGVAMAGGHQVHVWGGSVDVTVTAGSETRWGPAGFQVVLADQPQEMALRLQLLNANGAAASEILFVRTLARCEANLLVADFVADSAADSAPAQN